MRDAENKDISTHMNVLDYFSLTMTETKRKGNSRAWFSKLCKQSGQPPGLKGSDNNGNKRQIVAMRQKTTTVTKCKMSRKQMTDCTVG